MGEGNALLHTQRIFCFFLLSTIKFLVLLTNADAACIEDRKLFDPFVAEYKSAPKLLLKNFVTGGSSLRSAVIRVVTTYPEAAHSVVELTKEASASQIQAIAAGLRAAAALCERRGSAAARDIRREVMTSSISGLVGAYLLDERIAEQGAPSNARASKSTGGPQVELPEDLTDKVDQGYRGPFFLDTDRAN